MLGPITVVGAGNMGPGIAYSFAAGGFSVRLVGRSTASLEEAISNLRDFAYPARKCRKVIERISASTDLERSVSGCAMVIEAITEDLHAKQDLFAWVAKVCGDKAILASTTSALCLDDLTQSLPNRTRAIILHYFYPPAVIPVVEVVPNAHTAPEVSRMAVEYLETCGKWPVIVKRPVVGFVGNRLLHAMMSEAIALVRTGVASAADIDTVVSGSFPLRLVFMGLLEGADLAGLDLIRLVHGQVLPDLERLTSPDPLLESMVRANRLGAKKGQGFYSWTPEAAHRRRREVVLDIRNLVSALGTRRRPNRIHEIIQGE